MQTYTSTQAPTCRRLQPSLICQPLLEGSYYPLLSFTSYHWKGATTPSLKALTLSTTADHVSSIFILDPLVSTWHTLQATRFIHSVYLHQFFMISSVIQTRDSSSSDHYMHGCIVVLDLLVKNKVRPYRYSLENFFFHSQPLPCTPRTLILFSLYSFFL